MSDILDSLKTASFGQSTSLFGNGNAQQTEKAKSEYWLNIGYIADDGQHFVSLPKSGSPLDNVTPEEVKDPTSEYGQLLLASNSLLAQIKAVAATLQPGEAKILTGLTVQIRRKKATVTAVQDNSMNKFLKVMNF